ncbi:hypothetical protein C8A03DRAFT_37026 [Achaetomium macrosporum]|uniref:Uncharacterized protein n=1 Tax=Achaetomium macrosporum TaxID=79813 RepID=A0AAN7C4C3_9PEZI|nr:hypothetical protein C8A03DRAFT_37026 [Achaetomium macrosporum]
MASNEPLQGAAPAGNPVAHLGADTGSSPSNAPDTAAAMNTAPRMGSVAVPAEQTADGYGIGEPRPRKRRFGDSESRKAWKIAQTRLPSRFDETNWSSNDIEIRADEPTLRLVDHHLVFDEYRAHEPSVLEAVSEEVNWYADDPDRTEASGYLMKVMADDISIQAMATTMKELCKRHNAPVFTLHFEAVPMRTYLKQREEREEDAVSDSHQGQPPAQGHFRMRDAGLLDQQRLTTTRGQGIQQEAGTLRTSAGVSADITRVELEWNDDISLGVYPNARPILRTGANTLQAGTDMTDRMGLKREPSDDIPLPGFRLSDYVQFARVHEGSSQPRLKEEGEDGEELERGAKRRDRESGLGDSRVYKKQR